MSRMKGVSVLSDEVDELIGIVYRPKTAETRQTYSVILCLIQEALGDQPSNILYAAADEVLAVLKNEKLSDKEKKKEIIPLLEGMPEERFSLLLTLGKKITDYGSAETNTTNDDTKEDSNIISIQVESSSDEEEEEYPEEMVQSDKESDEGEEAHDDRTIHAENVSILYILSLYLHCLE